MSDAKIEASIRLPFQDTASRTPPSTTTVSDLATHHCSLAQSAGVLDIRFNGAALVPSLPRLVPYSEQQAASASSSSWSRARPVASNARPGTWNDGVSIDRMLAQYQQGAAPPQERTLFASSVSSRTHAGHAGGVGARAGVYKFTDHRVQNQRQGPPQSRSCIRQGLSQPCDNGGSVIIVHGWSLW